MNKKAAMVESVIGGIVLFLSFTFVVIFVGIFLSNFNDKIQDLNESSLGDELSVAQETSGDYTAAWSAFDLGFMILVIGAFIVSVIAIRLVEVNKWYIAIGGFLLMLVFGLVGIIVENFWDRFSSNSVVDSFVASYPFMNWFMSHFILLMIIYTTIVVIAAATSEGEGV